jgi:hypothetical protein
MMLLPVMLGEIIGISDKGRPPLSNTHPDGFSPIIDNNTPYMHLMDSSRVDRH